MKQIHLFVLTFITLFSVTGSAQKLEFNLATENTGKYVKGKSPGFDFDTTPLNGEPFFFSVDLPEGNYKVTVLLGNKEKESITTVKSESRRLMLLNIFVAAGETKEDSFTVNIRNTKIDDTNSVRIKAREMGKLIWDDKLTLEFGGINPSVQYISIEPADSIPTIFLAGNSTVVDEGEEPWCGWGQIFPCFFTPEVAIANYAESGEAANTFVSSQRFAKLLSKMKPGDFLFIEFGHNDQKQKGEGKGPYTSYKSDLKYLVDQTREKGGFPILVTSMHRRNFDRDGKVINTHGEYPDAMRQLASEEQVPLIDLNEMSAVLYEAWGVEDSKKAFVHYPAGTFPNQEKPLADNTHFNSYGGSQIARCIVKGIIDLNLPIRTYLRPGCENYDPAHPDAPEGFCVPPTPFSSVIKPDGN